MKKIILIFLMLLLLLSVTGCGPEFGDEALSDYERNEKNIERYEKLLASDELSARERRTVEWYLEAAKDWRDSQ